MRLLEHLYEAGVRALRPALAMVERGLPRGGSAAAKAAAALAGRGGAADAIVAWSRASRDPERRLVWLHGASAGELAGAEPVVCELRRKIPHVQVLVTFSSPSGASTAGEIRPDYAGFVPYDSVEDCRRAVVAARPSVLVIAAGDVWPGLTRAAASESVPTVLINGRVRRRSRSARRLSRIFLAPAYRRLTAAAAISDADADRLAHLGLAPGRIRVTGDAAFDRALRTADASFERLRRGSPRLAPTPASTLRLVAGSTWREDENALLRAVRPLLGSERKAQPTAPTVELVIVPHEPVEGALRAIRESCVATLGLVPRLLSRVGTGDAPDADAPLVVDVVGFLAELYVEADIAFVGGAFGRQGLHSVIEPAAAGIPVLFGPRVDRREAEELESRGGGIALETSRLGGYIRTLVEDAERRLRMGAAARCFVESGRGAGEAAASLVAESLQVRSPGRPSHRV